LKDEISARTQRGSFANLCLTPRASTERYGEANLSILNLIQLLQSRAIHQPERLAYTFLLDGEEEESHLTYGALEQQARAVGACLQGLGLRGERSFCSTPPGLEYIAAFWGCLYAGAVAVPAYPPRLNRNMERLLAIAEDARPSAALMNGQILSRLKPLLHEVPELRALKWLVSEEMSPWSLIKCGHRSANASRLTSGSSRQ
jgi:acyl-CoA synthetase (AMP-forming)/AMP-acid ligase II